MKWPSRDSLGSYYTAWSEYLGQDACDFHASRAHTLDFCRLTKWVGCIFLLPHGALRGMDAIATQRFPLIPTSAPALILHFPGSSCTSECIGNDALSSSLNPVSVLYVLATSLDVFVASTADAWLLVRSRGSGGWSNAVNTHAPIMINAVLVQL